MTNRIIPPIILDENGDITIFDNMTSCLQEIEDIDALDNVYSAFDSRAQPLRLEVLYDGVHILLDSDRSPEPNELLERLRSFAVRVGLSRLNIDNIESCDLGALIRILNGFLNPT